MNQNGKSTGACEGHITHEGIQAEVIVSKIIVAAKESSGNRRKSIIK